jgi:hypothetical protein
VRPLKFEPEKSKTGKDVYRITREAAAQGQLHTAIFLWFIEFDMASIHTLAVAANTLLHQIGSKVGKPSPTMEWLKSQPQSFQKRARDAQNFFKHANTDPNRVLSYAPIIAEIYLLDSIARFHDLYSITTPLMLAFALRFSLTYPDILPTEDFPVHLPKGFPVDKLAKLARRDFLESALALIKLTRRRT